MARRQQRDEWRARVGGGGWVALELGGAERLVARVRPDESGRLRVRELLVRDDGSPVTVDRLRALRLPAIEGLLNLPAEHAAITKRLDEPAAIDLGATLRSFTAPKEGRVFEKTGATSLRARAAGVHGPSRPSRGYSDAFYAEVADVYRAAFRRGAPPVAAVAEAWGPDLPRATAARWVKESRRRGKLEPAPAPGKKGVVSDAR